jgi:hypothetical protein
MAGKPREAPKVERTPTVLLPPAPQAGADDIHDINGVESWNANPFVWALTFTVHRCNVDTFTAQNAA